MALNVVKPIATLECADNCPKCNGLGYVADPSARWWQFLKTIKCDACGPGKRPSTIIRKEYFYRATPKPNYKPGCGVWTT